MSILSEGLLYITLKRAFEDDGFTVSTFSMQHLPGDSSREHFIPYVEVT